MPVCKLICLAKRTVTALIICMFFPAAPFSKTTISSTKSLETALEKAVTCHPDEISIFDGSLFDGGSDDPRPKLERLGVKIVEEPQHGGEIRYHFPLGVKVFGYEATEALFSSPSTTIFFVNLHTRSDHLSAISEALKLAPVPKGNPDGYGHFNEFNVREIKKLSDEKDIPPDTIFSGTGNSRDYIVIGCQNLSW
jgi:hypothetical protein